MSDELKPNNEGLRLLRQWASACERAVSAKRELEHARCDVSNTENALTKWFVPANAAVGTTWMLAVGDTFLKADVVPDGMVREDGAPSKGTKVKLEWHPHPPRESL